MTCAQVYVAIHEVMAELCKRGIAKDNNHVQNGVVKYKFRGIDDIYNTLCGILVDKKLLMLPRAQERTVAERESKGGGALFYTCLRVEFDLVSAIDGSKHTVCQFGEAMDSSDKSTNKAASAAYKYAAIQVFCIPTEGEDDADSTGHQVMSQRQVQERQQKQEQKAQQKAQQPPPQPKQVDPDSFLPQKELAEFRADIFSRGWTDLDLRAFAKTVGGINKATIGKAREYFAASKQEAIPNDDNTNT